MEMDSRSERKVVYSTDKRKKLEEIHWHVGDLGNKLLFRARSVYLEVKAKLQMNRARTASFEKERKKQLNI